MPRPTVKRKKVVALAQARKIDAPGHRVVPMGRSTIDLVHPASVVRGRIIDRCIQGLAHTPYAIHIPSVEMFFGWF